MATITKPFTFSAGAIVVASEHNSNFDTMYSEFNGSIANANVSASAGIVESKLTFAATGHDHTGATAGKLIPIGTGLTIASQAQGDVLYASSATVWARLGAGTAGQTLTTAGASANPSWAGMTTQGDVEYRDATGRARLGAGTSGQFLQTQGAGANPQWAAGEWTRVGTITLSAALSGALSGLDGNAHDEYWVVFQVSGSLGTGDATISIQPNGLTTNSVGYLQRFGVTTDTVAHNSIGWPVAKTATATGPRWCDVVGTAIIGADTSSEYGDKVANSGGRVCRATATVFEGSGASVLAGVNGVGCWTANGTNLTSITFAASAGTMTGKVEVFRKNT